MKCLCQSIAFLGIIAGTYWPGHAMANCTSAEIGEAIGKSFAAAIVFRANGYAVLESDGNCFNANQTYYFDRRHPPGEYAALFYASEDYSRQMILCVDDGRRRICNEGRSTTGVRFRARGVLRYLFRSNSAYRNIAIAWTIGIRQ